MAKLGASPLILNDYVNKATAKQLKSSLSDYFLKHSSIDDERVLPVGYHFIYLNPNSKESELNHDGYDSVHSPKDFQFKRRLWTGGELRFHGDIPFGTNVKCAELVVTSRTLRNNKFVGLKREIKSEENDSVLLTEIRNLVYTNGAFEQSGKVKSDQEAILQHRLTPSEVLLFRFSALTFNSHKIHYDKEYALTEGYPGLLVQGPLTVVLLLEWFNSHFSHSIKSFKYKNTSPIFLGDTITLCVNKKSETTYNLWIENGEREVHVTGEIEIN